MSALLVVVLALPLAAMAVSAVLPRRAAQAATVVCGVGSFGLALALIPAVATRDLRAIGMLRVDALSLVFLLATSFLYGAVAVYAVGYFAGEAREADRVGGDEAALFARYTRRFYLGINAFAWSMLCAPLVDGLALLWIAVEITTVVSALLVALDRTEGATEAAWKYVLIASAGLGIGLLATIVMYYAGSQVLGQSYDLSFDPLLRAAHQLPATPVRLAFVLAVVGFRDEGGPVPGAHVAAGCARRGADAGVGAAVRVVAGGQLLRDPALLPGRGRHARPAFPAAGAARVRCAVAAARGVVRA